jgi:hypothetical protein
MTMQKKRQTCRKNDAGLLIGRVVSDMSDGSDMSDTRQKQTMRHPQT